MPILRLLLVIVAGSSSAAWPLGARHVSHPGQLNLPAGKRSRNSWLTRDGFTLLKRHADWLSWHEGLDAS